jgi:hypothetical protein
MRLLEERCLSFLVIITSEGEAMASDEKIRLCIAYRCEYSITLCAEVRGRSGNLAEGVRGRQRRVHPSYIRYGFCQDGGDYP